MKHIEYAEIKLRLGDMLFTRDDEKERINFRKHRIHFKAAAAVFMDPDAVFENNYIDEYTAEERLDAIGYSAGLVIFVVYVERITINDNEIIRIISARRAEKEEKKTLC